MNDRLKRIIDNEDNILHNLKASKTDDRCPICNRNLYSVYNQIPIVLDGNQVLICEKDSEHRFFRGSRGDADRLYFSKHAGETSTEYDAEYTRAKGKWKEREYSLSQIKEVFLKMSFDEKAVRTFLYYLKQN